MAEFIFLGRNGSCQSRGSGNTSLLIRSEGHAMAVDLSCNISAAVDADVDVTVLTHEHIDHVYGLPSFLHQAWLRGRTKPLRIYVPSGMEYIPEGMLSLFKLREKKNMFEILIRPTEPFGLGAASVSFFATDHTATSAGLILEEKGRRLVYTSDTRPIPEAMAPAPSAAVLIHEASGLYEDRETLIKKGHSGGKDAAKLAGAMHAERLYLCHLPMDKKKSEGILEEAQTDFSDTFIPELLKTYAL